MDDNNEDTVPVRQGFKECFLTRYFLETRQGKTTTLDWLKTLDNDTFSMLNKEATYFLEQCQDDAVEPIDSPKLNDIMFLFFHLLAMELDILPEPLCDTGIFSLEGNDEQSKKYLKFLQSFLALVSMESLRRTGVIEIKGTGKITEPEKTVIRVIKCQEKT